MKDIENITDKKMIDDMYSIQEYTYSAYLKISNAYDSLQDVIQDYFDTDQKREYFTKGGVLAEFTADTIHRKLLTLVSMFCDGLTEFEIVSGLDTDRARAYVCDMSALVKQYSIMREHQKRDYKERPKASDLIDLIPRDKLDEALEIAEKVLNEEGGEQ